MDEEYVEQQQEDLQDTQEEVMEYQEEMADAPVQKKTNDLYSLFDKVRTTRDSTKVGNLNSTELGMLQISVRDAQYIGLLAATFHHKKVSAFARQLGEITLATSASKKGWFTELFVTNKKFSSKVRSSGSNQVQQKKWSIMGNKPQEQQQSEGQ